MCNRLQEVNGRLVEVCGRVRVMTMAGVHGAGVKRVTFHPATSTLVSCSGDPRTSLVVRGSDHTAKSYTFTVPKVGTGGGGVKGRQRNPIRIHTCMCR